MNMSLVDSKRAFSMHLTCGARSLAADLLLRVRVESRRVLNIDRSWEDVAGSDVHFVLFRDVVVGHLALIELVSGAAELVLHSSHALAGRLHSHRRLCVNEVISWRLNLWAPELCHVIFSRWEVESRWVSETLAPADSALLITELWLFSFRYFVQDRGVNLTQDFLILWYVDWFVEALEHVVLRRAVALGERQ